MKQPDERELEELVAHTWDGLRKSSGRDLSEPQQIPITNYELRKALRQAFEQTR